MTAKSAWIAKQLLTKQLLIYFWDWCLVKVLVILIQNGLHTHTAQLTPHLAGFPPIWQYGPVARRASFLLLARMAGIVGV